jgi:hypothetical protein
VGIEPTTNGLLEHTPRQNKTKVRTHQRGPTPGRRFGLTHKFLFVECGRSWLLSIWISQIGTWIRDKKHTPRQNKTKVRVQPQEEGSGPHISFFLSNWKVLVKVYMNLTLRTTSRDLNPGQLEPGTTHRDLNPGQQVGTTSRDNKYNK